MPSGWDMEPLVSPRAYSPMLAGNGTTDDWPAWKRYHIAISAVKKRR